MPDQKTKPPCVGCSEQGWLGLVQGQRRYHEKVLAPGVREVIRCTRRRTICAD